MASRSLATVLSLLSLVALAPDTADAAAPEILEKHNGIPTRVYEATAAGGFRSLDFNLTTRQWDSNWSTITTSLTPRDPVIVPLRWSHWVKSGGILARHDLFSSQDDGSSLDQLMIYQWLPASGAPLTGHWTMTPGTFFAKTGFTQVGPSVKNLFGTDTPGHNIYTPAEPGETPATALLERYWNGSGWVGLIDRTPTELATPSELLLGPEGAQWYDGEALVCFSIPGDVMCQQFHDHGWFETVLPPLDPHLEYSWLDLVTLRQAPVVLRYEKDDEYYFRMFVVGWNPKDNGGAGRWNTYGIERKYDDPQGWRSESGVGRWHNYGAPQNVVEPDLDIDGTHADPAQFAYRLGAWAEFRFGSDDSWVNVMGQDATGDQVVDLFYGHTGAGTPWKWQLGGGQATPESGFEVTGALSQRDFTTMTWRTSAIGRADSGMIYERYFDSLLGGGWVFQPLN